MNKSEKKTNWEFERHFLSGPLSSAELSKFYYFRVSMPVTSQYGNLHQRTKSEFSRKYKKVFMTIRYILCGTFTEVEPDNSIAKVINNI